MRVKVISVSLLLTVALLAGAYGLGLLRLGPPPIPDHLQTMGGDFTLQSADGPVALTDFRDKVVLIYFGFTSCADACPTALSKWDRAFDKLTDAELERVQGILVSVDPTRDSVEKLKEYTAFFHANIIGVTGSETQLREVVDMYRSDFVIEQPTNGEEYEVAHMSFVYVIDPQGQLRALLAHESPVDDIVQTIRYILDVAG